MTDECHRIRSGLGDRAACSTHGNLWPCRVRALSLSRPWTELILAGVKPIENRSWQTPHRGTLVVHAAKSYDPAALDLVNELAGDGMLSSDEDYARLDRCDLSPRAPLGYLGTVNLTGCHHSDDLICVSRETSAEGTCSPWAFHGSYHWEVADPRPFPRPVEGGGALGIFQPRADVLSAIRDLIWEVGADA